MEERRQSSIDNVLIAQGEVKQILVHIKDDLNKLTERVGVQNGRVSKLEDKVRSSSDFIGTVQKILWIILVPTLGGFVGFIWWGFTVYASKG